MFDIAASLTCAQLFLQESGQHTRIPAFGFFLMTYRQVTLYEDRRRNTCSPGGHRELSYRTGHSSYINRPACQTCRERIDLTVKKPANSSFQQAKTCGRSSSLGPEKQNKHELKTAWGLKIYLNYIWLINFFFIIRYDVGHGCQENRTDAPLSNKTGKSASRPRPGS